MINLIAICGALNGLKYLDLVENEINLCFIDLNWVQNSTICIMDGYWLGASLRPYHEFSLRLVSEICHWNSRTTTCMPFSFIWSQSDGFFSVGVYFKYHLQIYTIPWYRRLQEAINHSCANIMHNQLTDVHWILWQIRILHRSTKQII